MGDQPSSLQTVLRWVAVLPAAVLASFAVEALAGLYYLVFIPSEPLFWVNLIKSCLGSFLFVFVGYLVAPKAELPTAFVLACLMTLLGIGGFWAGVRLHDSFFETVAIAGPQALVPFLVYFWLREEREEPGK